MMRRKLRQLVVGMRQREYELFLIPLFASEN
jgi:hypothetical protein